jgi:GTP-binding protein HflX
VLDELGIDAADRTERLVEVWNKIDRLTPEELAERRAEAERVGSPILISAREGTGTEALLALIDRRLAAAREVVELHVGYDAGELLAWLHRAGEVLEQVDAGDGLQLKVAVAPAERARLSSKLGRPV